MIRWVKWSLVVALVFAMGCGNKQESTIPDTGARATVETFYNAVIANDAPRAYAVLDPESKRRVSANRFGSLARVYVKSIGFPADRLMIRSCEEQGEAATAHVTFAGHSAGHTRRYNDGITLRRVDGQWGIVLPNNFGQKAR